MDKIKKYYIAMGAIGAIAAAIMIIVVTITIPGMEKTIKQQEKYASLDQVVNDTVTALEYWYDMEIEKCEQFCRYIKEANDTQPDFMLIPVNEAYCSLGFNESIYNEDYNSNGVFDIYNCEDLGVTCEVKFETLGSRTMNCTK